ncbi:MAG: EamA family transporter [Desulfarculus sp.]|nr:EamA family transporter [Desulfarculus sp.]
MENFLLSWGVLVLSALANAYGAFVIKLGLNRQGPLPTGSVGGVILYFLGLLKSPLVISGVASFFLAPVLFSAALSRMEVSVAQPAMVGMNFAFLMVCAALFLGERITPRKLVGVAMVVAALFLL